MALAERRRFFFTTGVATNVVFLKAGRYLVAVDRAHHLRALDEKSIPAPGPVS